MSKLRISMRDLKNILRMHFVNKRTMRNIASITGIPYSTIQDNIALVTAKGMTWSQIENISEESLERLLSAGDKQRPLPDWAYVEKELKRPGVTLQLLWLEYKESHPEGYLYSRFCEMYEKWGKNNDVYTPMPHKAGEELFVDYSGDKMIYICEESAQPVEAEIFVATLGASNRLYVEASRSQKLAFWIESSINAFEYNGGVTELTIPDNLKSAVTTPDRYEPSINRAYEEMGHYYGTFIAPARSRKPKDKAKVEQSVQSVQREILAPLRNHTFFGITSLNTAILERLEGMNHRPFQKRPGSRQSCYEEVDKPMLKPLPVARYSYREWYTKIVVGQNHHILVSKHSYSVPCQYAREEVEAALDIKIIEVFCKGTIIARHLRSYISGGETTLREHMPPKYQHYFDSYDKEKLLKKAKELGPNTFAWAEAILTLAGRPPKLLCHTVQGALSLAKEYGKDRLDTICARALFLEIHSYKALKSMLIRGIDRLPLPLQGNIQSHLPQNHNNLRRAEHYA